MTSDAELIHIPKRANLLAVTSLLFTGLGTIFTAAIRFVSLLFVALIGFGFTMLYGFLLISAFFSPNLYEFAIGMTLAFGVWFLGRHFRLNGHLLELRPIQKKASSRVCDDNVTFVRSDGRVSVIDSPWWALPLCVLSVPGLIAAIPILFSICFPLPSQFSCVIGGIVLALPMIFSYTTFLRLSKKYYQIHIGKPGLLVISGSRAMTQSILWKNVKAVNLVRLEHIREEDFHADELDQQQIVLEHSEQTGESIVVALNSLNQKQRTKLARSLKENLSSKVFAESSLTLFKQLCPDKPKIESSNTVEIASFTEVWQNDMKRHIGRTNYVPLEVGAVLRNGEIKINSYLSSGGFSTTYVAEGIAFGGDRKVIVIKESSLPQGLNAEARQKISDMFAREARLLTKCDHPKIARVLDFFHENGREYLALEYLEGARLSDVISPQSKPSEAQCLLWGIELAEMLIYLHDLQPPIVHRDFTPDNIILSSAGHLHLIDFGAANEFLGGATGTLVGKQSYIAPEQFQGKATTQSDIYAMGAMLYFLLTAQEPLPLCAAHPRLLRPELSQELDELIASCTEPEAERRISSAQELLKRLHKCVSAAEQLSMAAARGGALPRRSL